MRLLSSVLLFALPLFARSEQDFRKAAPAIHRQAQWLEENPDAKTWGDSLKTVLAWGHDVPYATLGTAKVFEKEVLNLPKDRTAGRIASMLQVGFIELASEPDFKSATEFEMAKAGLTCMIRFYESAKRIDPGYSIPSMERYAGLQQSDALDEYIQGKLRK